MSDKMKERNSFNKKLLLFFGGVFFDRKKDEMCMGGTIRSITGN